MRKLGALAKFAPSLDQIRKDAAFACHGSRCSDAARAISVSVSSGRTASLRDKLNTVNGIVNGTIRYQRDQQIYRVADRWAKPSETMALGKGDCEDFAILKMAALHAMGVPADSMALVVVFDQRRNVYHAVLAVTAADRYFILDNVRNAVLTDRQLRDYMPLYSIVDGRGFFHGIKANASRQMARLQPIEMVAPGEGPEDGSF
ncbi:transglutaminase-like cysteine peptidase [Pseudomonas sp. R2.Fl]|nr:transglutaminase-like cysteine peptidase [Pseudomonas sp. R2.Fl]